MQKPLIFLLVVSGLIGAGIVLSFFGAQIATQNLTVKEEKVLPNSSIEIMADLDPSLSEIGVFGILLEKFDEGAVSVSVYDPLGAQIISKVIEKESTEERFEIDSSGTYKLLIQNSGLEEIQIVVGIGHMPDTSTLSVGITGFYVLIVGLVGMVGVVIYAIRNRKKEKLS